MRAAMRLLLLLQALLVRALNVSVVPAYFRSPKERRSFRTYGKWQIDERRCDKFIRNRAYDKTCQQMDPKPYELLPLLVTGAPGSGTRAVFELVYAMCHKATRECRQYPEFNTTLDAAVAALQPHGSPKPPQGTPPIIFKTPCCEGSATRATATWPRSVRRRARRERTDDGRALPVYGRTFRVVAEAPDRRQVWLRERVYAAVSARRPSDQVSLRKYSNFVEIYRTSHEVYRGLHFTTTRIDLPGARL